jgi:hypothetical protein
VDSDLRRLADLDFSSAVDWDFLPCLLEEQGVILAAVHY